MLPIKEEASVSRKDQIMEAAASLFAENGYYKTTTAHVAQAVGVTQPYVFHFFKSKEELYLAVLRQAGERIFHAFSSVEAPVEELNMAMGNAFSALLDSHRNEILLVMMAYTIPEPAIREFVKIEFEKVYESIRSRFIAAGHPNPELMASQFIGTGLIISMSEALQLPQLQQCYIANSSKD